MQLPGTPVEDHRRKVLFLCTGNTCRSPMAQGMFNQILEENGLSEDFCAISAGLNAFDGEKANEKAVSVLRKQGIDLSEHRSQRMNLQLLGEAELFVCMEQVHYDAMARFLEEKSRLILLGNGISDPYGKDESAYEACAKQIRAALAMILEKVKAEQ